MKSKDELYRELVKKRKEYKFVDDALLNPSEIEGGIFDSEHLNPWSIWQGNLDAEILLIGQDWGGLDYFIENRGKDKKDNNTNWRLENLFQQINIEIGQPESPIPAPVYLTNAVLGIKTGDMNASIKSNWYLDTSLLFIKPLIEIINPKIIIAMGNAACETIAKAYNLKVKSLKYLIENNPLLLPDEKILYAVYHCSNNGTRTRKFEQQMEDWKRIKNFAS